MNYIIRRASIADLPTLLGFEQSLIAFERPFDPTLGKEKISYYDLHKFINDKNTEVIVATLNDMVIASGYARIISAKPYLSHNQYAYLGFMFVEEKHRGKGLNKLVIDSLLDWCKEKGLTEVRLDVYQENPGAISAYNKIGFKKHLINMRMDIG